MKTIHKISGIFCGVVVGVFLGKSVLYVFMTTQHTPVCMRRGLHRGIQGFCGMA